MSDETEEGDFTESDNEETKSDYETPKILSYKKLGNEDTFVKKRPQSDIVTEETERKTPDTEVQLSDTEEKQNSDSEEERKKLNDWNSTGSKPEKSILISSDSDNDPQTDDDQQSVSSPTRSVQSGYSGYAGDQAPSVISLMSKLRTEPMDSTIEPILKLLKIVNNRKVDENSGEIMGIKINTETYQHIIHPTFYKISLMIHGKHIPILVQVKHNNDPERMTSIYNNLDRYTNDNWLFPMVVFHLGYLYYHNIENKRGMKLYELFAVHCKVLSQVKNYSVAFLKRAVSLYKEKVMVRDLENPIFLLLELYCKLYCERDGFYKTDWYRFLNAILPKEHVEGIKEKANQLHDSDKEKIEEFMDKLKKEFDKYKTKKYAPLAVV